MDPVTARKGTFIKSFGLNESGASLAYALELEAAAERQGIPGEFVYTRIPKWGDRNINGTWQIFLMPEGWDDRGGETLP